MERITKQIRKEEGGLLLQLIHDLRQSIQQAKNQADARGITSISETLRNAEYLLKLIEFETTKPA